MLIVLTTVSDAAAGEQLATKIIETRLAACVQVLPQMTSIYHWKGEIQRDPEHLLLIKTLPEKWDELREFISTNHGYEVPEIVAVAASEISGAYSKWLRDECKVQSAKC